MINSLDSKILSRLQEWHQKEGELPRVIQFYRELWQIQTEAKSRVVVPKPPLTDKLVHDRLCTGTPLLPFEDFSPDWDEVSSVLKLVTAWMGKDSEAEGDIKNLLNIASNRSTLRTVAEAWYQGRSATNIATVLNVDSEVLASVIAATLKPFLQVYASLLLPEVKQDLWRRGYCPVCGGTPDFSYLDKDNGARLLLCSHCDAEWLYKRLECPYCGTQDQHSLAFFSNEEEAYPYRIYVCEQCHKYIKAMDLRRAKSEVLLPLERLITLDLDALACEKGYAPGWDIAMR